MRCLHSFFFHHTATTEIYPLSLHDALPISDIALSNAMANEILARGLEHREFIANATSGFDEYRASVAATTPEEAEKITRVPADAIRRVAVEYASAKRAMICWTLGITEHHNAVDNVFALINLGLLAGHVGRYGSGLNPLRGQNNVQGGGDMGAIPDRLPGFQDVRDDAARGKFEEAWGVKIPPVRGKRLNEMFDAVEHGEMHALYVVGENPLVSEADRHRTESLLRSLDFLVVQDVTLTETAKLADVVFPAAAGWCESEGTVTNSERRVQRVRQALAPPAGVRDDMEILCDLSRKLGHDLGNPTAEELWNEVRSLSPAHAGMSYSRLEALGGIQWPCYDESHPGEMFLHGRLWQRPVVGPRAPFSPVEFEPPVDQLDEQYPIRLTTGRRLDSYNTGVQTSRYPSPLRRDEALDLSPEDGTRYNIREGEKVRVSSRRGSVVAPVHFDPGLRPGLAFLTLHFHNQVATNDLTIDAIDPKSGTAEFKATAIRIEKFQES